MREAGRRSEEEYSTKIILDLQQLGGCMNEHLLCEDCGELVDECLCEEMLDQLESDEEDVYEELLVDVEEQVDDDMVGEEGMRTR